MALEHLWQAAWTEAPTREQALALRDAFESQGVRPALFDIEDVDTEQGVVYIKFSLTLHWKRKAYGTLEFHYGQPLLQVGRVYVTDPEDIKKLRNMLIAARLTPR